MIRELQADARSCPFATSVCVDGGDGGCGSLLVLFVVAMSRVVGSFVVLCFLIFLTSIVRLLHRYVVDFVFI